MVRNRRHNTGIDWPKRHVRTIFVEFNEQEQALYNDIEIGEDKTPSHLLSHR